MNKHRNEFTVMVGDKSFTIRPTLALLEEQEQKFATKPNEVVRPSRIYHMAGFLLTKSNQDIGLTEAVEMVFDAGMETASKITAEFFKTAYRTSDKEEEGKKEAEEAPLYLS